MLAAAELLSMCTAGCVSYKRLFQAVVCARTNVLKLQLRVSCSPRGLLIEGVGKDDARANELRPASARFVECNGDQWR